MTSKPVFRHSLPGAVAAAVILAAAAAHAQPVMEIVDDVPGTFIDISATGAPMDFFYEDSGLIQTTLLGPVAIGNSGGVAIGSPTGGLIAANGPLPVPHFSATPNAEIYFPFWDDIGDRQGNVYWQEMADRVIVQWDNKPFFPDTGVDGITFQVQLFPYAFVVGETAAQFIYHDMDSYQPARSGGDSATIGWQWSEIGPIAEWSVNQAGAVSTGDVLTVRVAEDVVGACCFEDGSCSDATITGCLALGGTHAGEGTSCGTYACPDLTAQCCFIDGTCTEATETDCLDQDGVFGGLGTDCSTPCPDQRPANDSCSMPAVIAALPFSQTLDTNLATRDGPTSVCNSFTSTGQLGNSVWYSYTPDVDCGLTITIDTPGGFYQTVIGVFDSCAADVEYACAAISTRTVQFVATAGTPYLIGIGSWGNGDLGGLTEITVDCRPIVPAPNDDCAGAIALAEGAPLPGTTFGATGTDVASCGFDEIDVWYTFDPEPNSAYTVSTTAATQTVSASVFTACQDSGGVELACSSRQSFGFPANPLAIFYSDAAGSPVFIRIASDEAVLGSDFEVLVEPAAPGFVCQDALAVDTLPYLHFGNNTDAGADGPPGSCNYFTGPLDNSAWYAFTPATTMDVYVTFEPQISYGLLAAYQGASCGSLTELGCTEAYFTPDERVLAELTLTVTGGQTYFFVVGTAGPEEGSGGGEYTFEVLEIPGACTGTDGLCRELLSSDCASQGGAFTGGVCPIGACCLAGDACSVMTAAGCANLDGAYLGDDTDCGEYVADDTVVLNFEDISTTGAAIALDDDTISGAQQLGFQFEFYGNIYSQAYVCSNGFLAFDADAPAHNYPQFLPDAAAPNNLIAFWWKDLNPSNGGTIHTQTLGAAPDRRFIVQFTNVPHYNDQTLTITAQVKLFEGSNAIEIHYQNLTTDFSEHLIGIENADGTQALQYWRLDTLPPAGASFALSMVEEPSPCLAPACICETDAAAGVDVFDLLAYLDDWFPALATADIDGQSGVDVFDLLFFLDCWFPASAGAPCP